MDNCIYFIISYPRTKKESPSDIDFIIPENKEQKPVCIHCDDSYDNKIYFYRKIYKVNKSLGKGKKATNFYFEFETTDDRFVISFDSKGATFVYDLTLEVGKKIIDITRKVNQNKIDYNEKMSFFEAALKKNGEDNKIDELYKETINLYVKKKGFSLLISLFLKIYKKKDLCSDLLKKFREMNGNPKDNEKNMDRKGHLKDYTSIFSDIKSESDNLIESFNYEIIDFYGLILCYLNFYDYDNFSEVINELSKKNPEDLYEILLIYSSHFKYPIHQNTEFFIGFIKYAILNKDFPVFLNGLKYIKDLEVYINVIDENKEDFYNRYIMPNELQKNEKNIIKVDKTLKIKRFYNTIENKNLNQNEITTSEINSTKQNISESDYNINQKNVNNAMLKIIKKIESIINFSKGKKIFFIYFTNEFWKELLNNNNEATQDNIKICSFLRVAFIKYYKLVMEIFEKKTKKFSIKNEAINYYENDEFAFILNQIIRKFINENKELTNIEKLRFITQYNPYYNEEKYYNQVDSDIFNSFDLNNIDDEFIEDFRKMGFENIFKESISEYINKLISKIKTISNFDAILKIININEITEKNIFLDSLNKKYDSIIKPEIGLLTDKKLNEAIRVVANIALKNFIFEVKEKKFNFIKNRVKKLNKNIIPLVFIEIIKINIEKENKSKMESEEDEEKEDNDTKENKNKDNKEVNNENVDFNFNDMKEYIFNEFTNKLENENDIKNIIKLIDCLEEKLQKEDIETEKNENDKIEQKDNKNDKEIIVNEFLKKLMDKNLFTKDEFFSKNINIKISLLYELNKEKKIKKSNEEYYQNIEDLLGEIRKDIIEGNIQKRKLDEFLENNDTFIIQRLSLITIILDTFNPAEEYDKLKKKNEEINKYIGKLKYIKENIIIYFKETYQEKIKQLIDTIKDNQNKQIKQYKGGKIKDLIEDTSKLEEKADIINNVKNFLLFNVIYEMNAGKDEDASFNFAYNKLDEIGNLLKENTGVIELYKKFKDIFDKIKEKLSNNEERAQNFIKNLLEHYDINNENLIDELTILFKSKKYELDINSMIFFFKYFETQNESWNNKLSEKYENLSSKDFSEIKNRLTELKNNKIYDYQHIQYYNKLFTCLYEKKEAVEFLFNKTGKDIDKLKDRIQPTDRTISIKDIIDTEECNSEIIKMKKIQDNNKIFTYIQTMNEKTINQFENYSKIYQSVIELERNDEDTGNLYELVYDIIKDATFNIYQDSEKFLYLGTESKYADISMETLTHLKNRIHLKNEKEEKKDSSDNDKLKYKRKILIFFKTIISNLEVIIKYMNVLRNKGSSLPIKITIQIKILEREPTIIYYLGEQKTTFENIRNFLFNAKTTYISQLEGIYKDKLNLRFLYGQQFRSIMKHLESGINMDSFLRYILNNTDNNIKIKEGYKAIIRHVDDFINQYEMYNLDSLENISEYITSLFQSNDKTLEAHYNKMRIIEGNSKGIYLHECEDNSMEEFIINLYWDKINELPIAQNVLITSKETSTEEIQSFFHRAILCNYNTLFVVEINDSFSDFQQSKMNNYIDSLLSYKNQRYNETATENVDKKNTKEYLDSCIVFVYDTKNKNITSFLKEIGKLDIQKIGNKKNEIKISLVLDKNQEQRKSFLSELGNIFVVKSEICGLGKSEEIKRCIHLSNKQYFHFPLGGILTKKVIYDKLDSLLEKIKNVNYKDVSIHLDLTESKEKSIINEFFFAFLITKFYTNNENILYIPKDITIYIEIPNCFDDYLSKFSILKIFPQDTLTVENMPRFNYPQEIIMIFDKMLDIKSNEEIQKFVQKYINIPVFSYHQINIFIKIFIAQFGQLNKKISFFNNGKDVTEQRLKEFAMCSKYFTYGGFSQLLTGLDNSASKTKNYIDKLSIVYNKDLNIDLSVPLIFVNKEKEKIETLYIPHDSKIYQDSKDYLKCMKYVLNIPNEVEQDKDNLKSLLSIIEEKNNNYVITNDNFKKMILLLYRIKANVPVIIMGETGCGKTALVTKLNQLVNNGKTTVEIINIHPGITDKKLCEIMKEKNEIAEKKINEELWIFFDELNTCLSMSLLTEIFINRTYNGNKLNDNIRLIGACNPYRRRAKNKEKCGLSMSDDNEEELVYIVEPLPQSLLYYVYCFGSLGDIDEKKYIHSIIEKLFTKEEKIMHEITRDAISACHIYLRKAFDPSVVSLREIARFAKCIDFFQQYFSKKNNYLHKKDNLKNNKLRSIICSIYLCYYIRLTDDKKRSNFESILRPILLQLINNEQFVEEKGGSLIEQIKNQELKNEMLTRPDETINNFKDFLRIEQEFILNQIELDSGIGKNTLLKENVFLLFLSVVTNIPLIIIGKPGSGKSLSAQLINKSMKGKYSKNKFFQLYPQIIQIYFQGSESSEPEDVENLFDKAEKRLNHFKKKKDELELPIIMVLFDELGLAERSKKNPLKVLHSKLEYSGKQEGISFIGISNYSLDAAKINRALVLSVPDLDQKLDEIISTSQNIVESINEKLIKDQVFSILSKTYFDYKQELQFIKELVVYKQFRDIPETERNITIQNNEEAEQNKSNKDKSESDSIIGKEKEIIKENQREKRQFESIKKLDEFNNLLKKENKIRKDFHGNRDFYNLIKGIAIELGKLGDVNNNDKVPIIIKYIERNFGGIEYEIDIDFNTNLDDIREKVKEFKEIIEDYDAYDQSKILKLNSVFLFKKIYNLQFKKDPNNSLKIIKEVINDYNLNKCINENIKDINSRYLLLQVKPSLATLIYQNIKLQNPLENIVLYNGSSFEDDNNKDYRFRKINQIQDDARYDKLIVLENLNQIHPFLFDLYNRNYIIKDEKKFVRICLENDNEQLTLVEDKFRIIILVDNGYINQCDLAFLSRFEIIDLTFDKLLDNNNNNLKAIANNLIEEFRFKNIIKKHKKMNYSLKELFINCGNEDIQGLIYYFSKESKKKDNEADYDDTKEEIIDENLLRDKVISKLYRILPQDIICVLPENNIIKEKYNELKNINNFKEYKEFISKDENLKYKISLIYTYTSIANVVEGLNKGMSFMISEIRSEDGLKTSIEEIQKKNEYNKFQKDYYICIHFEQSNSKNLKFVSNFILNTFKNDKYNYIFIIHINRNFSGKKGERIYSLPDIDPSINQIFIDDLNCNNNIRLNDLLTKDIKEILEEKKEELKLDLEFTKALNNFLLKELNDKQADNDNSEFIKELVDFINDEDSIREKIMEIAYKLIDDNKTEDANCRDIIERMYETNYINKYTLDIASCLIDYIKENIFIKYLKKVFMILEDNNIFTTLYENIKNKFKNLNKNLVEELIKKFLDSIEKKENYVCKFLYAYNVPGFYNFYVNFSDYINKNIKLNYANNEKKLRELLKQDVDKINDFYTKENDFLDTALNEIITNYKMFYGIINKIPIDLVIKDYITYCLQKYRSKDDIYNIDDMYHKIIEILLKIRFNDEKTIIKNNKGNKMNNLIIKLIWIESNMNYILNIFSIIENGIIILNNNSNKFLNKIEELIFKEKSIKYITNESKNPLHTKEVNECYYLLLAGICYCITSDEIKLIELSSQKSNDELEIEISYYNYLMIEINKVLQKLNDDLYIFLNEMYIIDELIQIIDLFNQNYNMDKINEIKNAIRENALIIQKYTDETNNDTTNLSQELCNNFDIIYNLIMEHGEIIKKDSNFYDKLRYIYFKEIKKIPDEMYRYKILEKVLEENQIIKKSIDMFQILLKKYLKTDEKFQDNKDNILNGDDMIIKLIERKLKSNNLVLSETLLYLFEKTSLIYINNALNNTKIETNIEEEPLAILQSFVAFLDYYIFKPDLIAKKLKETCKIFVLGYIKVFIYTFIKIFEKIKNPNKIIDVFNGNSTAVTAQVQGAPAGNLGQGNHPVYKMIRIYIYKILYNNYKIDVFIDEANIKKYKLNDYIEFNKNIIKTDDLINIYKIDYKIKTLNDNDYDSSYKLIEKYKKEGFKNKINEKVFNIKDFGIDNFYIISYNFALSNLQMENSLGNDDFYKNICEPLFSKGNNILSKAIGLFYNPDIFNDIKVKYKIDPYNFKPIIFGYRYILNEIDSKNNRGIYYPLYENNNQKYLAEKYYPGNDTKFIEAYSYIIDHFNTKPEEGCYVCLCDNLFYHSVASGFPTRRHLKMNCPGCKRNIGTYKKGNNSIAIVKRENYYRIFKDQKEIDSIINGKSKLLKDKLKEINYMTLDQFKEKYINKYFKKDKGIYISDKKSFINDMKVVRNLSLISYRILNYILYTNLFFAKLITGKNYFDKYVPKGMSWSETLYECWILIKNQLIKYNIYSMDEFMNYIFIEIFPILNKEKNIDNYDDLIKLEDKLEKLIQKNIKAYKEEDYKMSSNQKQNDNDKNSLISLLKESFSKDDYSNNEYPFYEYFYYTDYLNEDVLNKKLGQMYENKYPALKKYLENRSITKKDKYSLDNLNLFNTTLNIIADKYFNKISKEYSTKTKMKDTEIYKDDNYTGKINKFIEFYNSLDDIKDSNNNNIKLSIDNSLADFFVDDNNNVGMTYKYIYSKFINNQNKLLEPLLDMKISKTVFDKNCKTPINIQQINEREILNFTLPKKVSIIDILFNSSYRKILDSEILSYKSYREYEINYDKIEDYMTELILKNKKLLNDEISGFVYNNEVFNVQLTDFISIFKKRYSHKPINIHDKVILYKFSNENKNNVNLNKNMINDFITLIKYLNDEKRDNNKETSVKEESKIYQVIDNNIKDSVSKIFINIFDKNDGLTVDKAVSIFDYYLKLIFDNVKNDLYKYQMPLKDNSKVLINNYYNQKDPISKKDISYALRLFSTLVLFEEENKEEKIKSNSNNFASYLKEQDLWTKDIYDNINKNLNELKLWNVEINQIIYLLEFLGLDYDSQYFEDVIQRIENEKAEVIKNIPEVNNEQKAEIKPQVEEEEYDPFPDKDDDDGDDDDNRD